ncbi:MAG: MBL fold metallo-hydrolase [Bdellovibrionales bacterium]
MIQVERIPLGPWKTNCFVVYNKQNESFVVDPGDDALEPVSESVKRLGLSLKAILCTHAHLDHVGSVTEIKEAFGVPAYLHSGDQRILSQINMFRTFFQKKQPIKVPVIDHDLSGETELNIASFKVQVIAVPGHTPGGVAFLIENCLFTGDTVMEKGMGRTDLPGSDRELLVQSVKRLFELPAETHFYPGHGKPGALSVWKETLMGSFL